MIQKIQNYLVLLLVFSGLISISQNETKKWFFGNGAGLDFSAATPTVISGGAITSSLGCAGIADATGNLLFYTDGATIYDQTHSTMANGNGLYGGGVAQSAMIIKKPTSSNEYYVFTQQSTGLYYSIVDISLASGNGSVTTKNVTLYSGTCAGKLTATRACNGNDYWLLAVCSDSFYAYSVGAVSVNTTPVISTNTLAGSITAGPYISSPSSFSVGCMKLSPNGKKLFTTASEYIYFNYSSQSYRVGTQLYDFDNSTGVVSAGKSLTYMKVNSSYAAMFSPFVPYGCEFSPDGSKVYFTNNFDNVAQFDLCSLTPSLAVVPLFTSSTSTVSALGIKRSFQLAADGNIYVACSSNITNTLFIPTNSLGVITNPNAQTGNALFNANVLSLGAASCQWGLPNFPSSMFEQRPTGSITVVSGPCSTRTFNPVQPCSASGYSVLGYQWNFGDPLSGLSNVSFLSNPSHSYSANGVYTVKMVRSFDCFTDTTTKIVTISNAIASNFSLTGGCGIRSATISSSGGTGPYTYTWSPGSQTSAVLSFSTSGSVYSVTTLDGGTGCSITNTVNLSNVVLNATINSSSLACNGYSNATAIAFVSGGSGSYTWLWSSNNYTAVLQNSVNLPAGTYSVTISDPVNLCAITRTFVIQQPPAIQLYLYSGSSACVGNSITLGVNVFGGTAPYQTNWVAGPSSNVNTVSEALPGTYVYTVNCIDANNCSTSGTVSAVFKAYPVLSVANASVCSGHTVSLIVTGSNSHTWQPGSFTGNIYNVAPAASTIYTVSADSLGCVSNATTMVSVVNSPSLTVSGSTLICKGESAILTVSGASTYSWSSGSNASTVIVTPATNSIYAVTGYQMPTNCSSDKVFSITVSDCLSLGETKNQLQSMSIHPNPSEGRFIINSQCNANIIVINQIGELIVTKQLTLGDQLLDLSLHANGIYYLSVFRENENPQTFKLVLNH